MNVFSIMSMVIVTLLPKYYNVYVKYVQFVPYQLLSIPWDLRLVVPEMLLIPTDAQVCYIKCIVIIEHLLIP